MITFFVSSDNTTSSGKETTGHKKSPELSDYVTPTEEGPKIRPVHVSSPYIPPRLNYIPIISDDEKEEEKEQKSALKNDGSKI